MRGNIVRAMLIALFLILPSPVFSADPDFVPDEERAFTRESGPYICNGSPYFEVCFELNVAAASYCRPSDNTGDRRAVACALETAFACIIGKNVDPEACRRVGGAPDPDCSPISLMGVRYRGVAIYGLDRPGAWPPVLPMLSGRHRRARIVFRAGFCRASWNCAQPDTVVYGDVEKVGEEWRFGNADRQAWRRDPYLHRQLCEGPR